MKSISPIPSRSSEGLPELGHYSDREHDIALQKLMRDIEADRQVTRDIEIKHHGDTLHYSRENRDPQRGNYTNWGGGE